MTLRSVLTAVAVLLLSLTTIAPAQSNPLYKPQKLVDPVIGSHDASRVKETLAYVILKVHGFYGNSGDYDGVEHTVSKADFAMIIHPMVKVHVSPWSVGRLRNTFKIEFRGAPKKECASIAAGAFGAKNETSIVGIEVNGFPVPNLEQAVKRCSGIIGSMVKRRAISNTVAVIAR